MCRNVTSVAWPKFLLEEVLCFFISNKMYYVVFMQTKHTKRCKWVAHCPCTISYTFFNCPWYEHNNKTSNICRSALLMSILLSLNLKNCFKASSCCNLMMAEHCIRHQLRWWYTDKTEYYRIHNIDTKLTKQYYEFGGWETLMMTRVLLVGSYSSK